MMKLAIFDMDGTVFESYLNWEKIREQLKIKVGENILKEIYRENRIDETRLKILEKYEKENTIKTKPIKGIEEFLRYLKSINVITSLITNNNRENTDFLLGKFKINFDRVITREVKLWKPEPDAFIHVMNIYKSKPGETISIGDSHYDIKASRAAQISQIFIIKNKQAEMLNEKDITYFEDYFDLKGMFNNTMSTCRHH